MKILIIATPRSGSTRLTNTLASMLNYIAYQEPYNFYHPSLASKTFPKQLPDNVITKTIFSQLPHGSSDSFEFYKKEISRYDKVIILSRKDIQAAYESFNHNITNNPKGNWHSTYIYEDLNFDTNLFKNYLNWVNDIIEFSLNLNIDITWYEDLYFGDQKNVKEIIDKWSIGVNSDTLIESLKNSKKYRLTKNKTLI